MIQLEHEACVVGDLILLRQASECIDIFVSPALRTNASFEPPNQVGRFSQLDVGS